MSPIILDYGAAHRSQPVNNRDTLVAAMSSYMIREASSSTETNSTPTLNEPRIRTTVIIGSVIVLSLITALCGCVIASCHGKRRKLTKRAEDGNRRETSTRESTFESGSSPAEESSEDDAEMLAQLDTIMASSTFQGREWSAYKRELRAKAERQARGAARTSQGVPLPISVHSLRSKMRHLSRSLLRSLTRSDAAQGSSPEPLTIDEVLVRPEAMANAPQNSAICIKEKSPPDSTKTAAQTPPILTARDDRHLGPQENS